MYLKHEAINAMGFQLATACACCLACRKDLHELERCCWRWWWSSLDGESRRKGERRGLAVECRRREEGVWKEKEENWLE